MGMSGRKSIVVCFDSFKDCLEAHEVGDVVINTLKRFSPFDQQNNAYLFLNVPLSDGGEGFLYAFQVVHRLEKGKYDILSCTVRHVLDSMDASIDKNQQRIDAEYLVLKNKDGTIESAVLESAKCIGIQLIPKHLRNPFHTSSYGLGQLLKHVILDKKINNIRLGLGGSGTSDGGLGALQALGVRLFCKDENSNQVFEPEIFYGKHLPMLVDLDATEFLSIMPTSLELELACDVNNPFIGPNGAVHVFSEQKGAKDKETRDLLENGMVVLNNLYKEKFGLDLSNIPGTGAAGGISGSIYVLFSQLGSNIVTMKRGVEIIAESVELKKKISEAALVITGEGHYDKQSGSGKVVSLVQEFTYEEKVPLIIICGQNSISDLGKYAEHTKILALVPDMFNLEESMQNTKKCLEELVTKRIDDFRVQTLE
jgi:glycerate kinase